MNSLAFLVPLALLLGATALAAFFWTLRSGQYDDLEGAGARIFVDEAADRAGARHSLPPPTRDVARNPDCADKQGLRQ